MRLSRDSRHIKRHNKTVPRQKLRDGRFFYSLVFARIYKLLYELIGVLAESDYARSCVGFGERSRGDKNFVPVASHELRERRVRCDCRLPVRGQQIIYEVVVGVAEIVVILISDEPCRIRESAGGSVNEQVARKIFVCTVRLESLAYGCAGRTERAELRVMSISVWSTQLSYTGMGAIAYPMLTQTARPFFCSALSLSPSPT